MKRTAASRQHRKPIVGRQSLEQVKERLREMEKKGEAIFHPQTNFGPLPVLKLARKLRKGEWERILRAAKGCDD
jgi:hypothetical protein